MPGMLLTPTERDRLLIFTAAELARARRARGLRLNVPETIALVADTVCEAARDGAPARRGLAAGRAVLGPDDVLPGVADIVTEVRSRRSSTTGPGWSSSPTRRGRAPRRAAPGARAPGAGRRTRPPRGRTRRGGSSTPRPCPSASPPLPLLRGQPPAALRPGGRLRPAPGRPGGGDRAVRPGRRGRASGWCRSAGTGSSIGFAGLVDGPLDAPGAREAALGRRRGLRHSDDAPASGHGPVSGVTDGPRRVTRTGVTARAGRPGQARRHRAGRRGRARRAARPATGSLLAGFGKTARDGMRPQGRRHRARPATS